MTCYDFLAAIFAGNVHAKRMASLANGALGVMASASLAAPIIGHSRAQARGLLGRHAVKQVDRLLSNQGIVVWDMFAAGTQGIGQRKAIVVAMDWTDFDAEGQTTLALKLVYNHGRATPLLWLTFLKDKLKNTRNDSQDLRLARLAELLPDGVSLTILADRGFGDTKLFDPLETLGFDYVIHCRGNVHVTAAGDETRAASEWVGKEGRARKLRNVELTTARHKVGAVVCVHARDMKAAWRSVASNAEATAREITNYYARGWTIEPRLSRHEGPSLRHEVRGYSHRRSTSPRQHVKVNAAKRRTHSVFRQGCMLYERIPSMPEVRSRPLVEQFLVYINPHPASNQTFSCV